MKLKSLFALLLLPVLALSFAACNGNPASPTDGVEPPVRGPLAGESDEKLIARFTSEYEKALKAEHFSVSSSVVLSRDGDPMSERISSGARKNGDWFAQISDQVWGEGEPVLRKYTYQQGVYYTILPEGTTEEAVDAATASARWDELKMDFARIPVSEFASATLIRNYDGSFVLDVTLTDSARDAYGQSAVAELAGIPGTAAFSCYILEIAFTMDGALSTVSLRTDVTVTEGETDALYTKTVYVQYHTTDPARIVIPTL